MSECQSCGRADGHWLGCPEALREHARNLVEPDFAGALCERDGCSERTKEWSGRGARPKYCAAGHKKEE